MIRTIGATEFIGAGNILGRRWILTVAANVLSRTINRRTEILCGRFDLSLRSEVTEQRMRIANAHVHPDYRAGGPSSSDIALLQLTADLHYSDTVQPIALPVAGVMPYGISSLIGWAGTDDVWIGQRLQRLQLARVAVVSTSTCASHLAQWSLRSNTTHFCTGPATGGLSPCNADAGSSLLQRSAASGNQSVIVGLVSLPQGCGAPLWLGTYTRVSAFVPWLNQVMQA